jgi:hypothetical protein
MSFGPDSKARGDALDHVLFVGPPGLGKTTLAQIVARELGVSFRSTSGPVIAKAGDLAAQLTNLEERDVLFIDEIHRLNPAVEEILYSAMEDYQLDLIIGEGPAARSVKIDLPKFTLVGATTRAGLLTTPLGAGWGSSAGHSTTSGAGGTEPRDECGRRVLSCRRQPSMTTLASWSVEKTSPLSSSSRSSPRSRRSSGWPPRPTDPAP